jgi:hypothetical protein
MTHPDLGPDTPVGRMLADVLEGRVPNVEDAKRQLAVRKGETLNIQVDELPGIWRESADAQEKHGVNEQVANAMRNCAANLEVALINRQHWSACEYQVGLYSKTSLSEEPYYRRVIKYRETAAACAEQWRTQFATGDQVEIRIVPLYKARVTQQMQPVYQVRDQSSGAWTDTDYSTHYKFPPDMRRKLWHRESSEG